jgi:hypothetical protein
MYKDIFTLINSLKYSKTIRRVFFFENNFIEPHLAPYLFKNKNRNETIIVSLYKIQNEQLKNFKIFQFNKIFFLNLFFLLLKIRYCYSSTPDIDNSAFQRSIFKKTKYIYIQHSPLGLNKIYRDNAFTNFDVVQVINNFQKNDLIDISKIKKKKIKVWCGKYLFLKNKGNNSFKYQPNIKKKKKILIAPTWGTDFFETNIHLSIKENLNIDKYNLFIRPHIMSTLKNKNLIRNLEKNDFQISSGKIDFDSFDLLITDWSGIYIEFAKIKKIKSILIQNKEKILNKKFSEFKNESIDLYARKKLGIILIPNQLSIIESKVNDIFQNQQKYVEEIDNFFKDNFY